MATPAALSRVIIVNDNEAVKSAPLTAQLSKTFKTRSGKIDADYAVPGMYTVAFCVVNEPAVRFACFRGATLEKLKKMKGRFKDCYVLFLHDTPSGMVRFSHMATEHSLPPAIYCSSLEYAHNVIRAFASAFSREKQAQRAEQLKQLEAHFTSKRAAHQVLGAVPGIALESQDRQILQDCYGSIAAIATRRAEQILEETPVSRQSAVAVERFFNEVESVG